jgi:hypothetical protein
MAESNKFECGGFQFEVARLPVKKSLKGLKLVGQVLLPALAAGAAAKEGSVGDAVERAVAGLDCLPEILDLFVPHSKFVGPTGKSVAFEAFVDDTFSGKPEACVEFIARCVQLEYSGFLAASGGNGFLGNLLAKVNSTSPIG